ncbi:MAG: tetratricopeptide repeat protein [Gammaproteobacteria bacterium]|nr:tetratricopeptide repeat protein [Gammaproteobacteria bacterium]
MNKTVFAFLSGVISSSIVFALLWFFVLQPGSPGDEAQEAESLAAAIKLFDDKQYDEAIRILEAIPDTSVHAQKALYRRGAAYLMLKNYESAVKHLEQSLALDTRDSSVLYALGVSYYKLGHIKLAKGYFASVLEINPDDLQAKGLMDIMAGLERHIDEQKAEQQPGQAAEFHKSE